MTAAPCNRSPAGYTERKRLGNANLSGPPHRQCGIFMSAIRPGLHCQSPAIGELAGGTFRKAVRRSQVRFPKPARSPAPLSIQGRVIPAVGDKAVFDSEFVPPRTKNLPDTPVDAERDEAIATVRSILSDMSLLAEWLETEPLPTIPHAVIYYMAVVRYQAHGLMPALTRH